MSKTDNNRVCVIEAANLPVELYRILKLESMVQSGGEAKHVIGEGLVRVNGEIETRKRKKIFSGDIIEFEDKRIKISTTV